MADNMFGDVVASSITLGGKRRYAVPLSIVAHTLIIVAAIIAPLIATSSAILPTPPAMLAFVSTPALSPPPPPPAPPRVAPQTPLPLAASSGAAPIEAPHEITPERQVQANRELVGAIETGTGVVPGSLIERSSTPPPPPTPAVVARLPVPVGGNIKQPAKAKDVRPSYPQIAQTARVQGLVIIEATIGPTGKVQDARVLRSIPLLDAAALDAVRQWEYSPTLLNGIPIAVVMTVTVDFRLQ